MHIYYILKFYRLSFYKVNESFKNNCKYTGCRRFWEKKDDQFGSYLLHCQFWIFYLFKISSGWTAQSGMHYQLSCGCCKHSNRDQEFSPAAELVSGNPQEWEWGVSVGCRECLLSDLCDHRKESHSILYVFLSFRETLSQRND